MTETAFQADAFQNNAFQVGVAVLPGYLPPGLVGVPADGLSATGPAGGLSVAAAGAWSAVSAASDGLAANVASAGLAVAGAGKGARMLTAARAPGLSADTGARVHVPRHGQEVN